MGGADTTSSLKPFHVSTHLCGKLYFFTSLTHPPFLNFLLCDFVALVATSSLKTSFSLSTLSMPLTNLYNCIRSPLSLLCSRVGNSIALSLSSYVIPANCVCVCVCVY